MINNTENTENNLIIGNDISDYFISVIGGGILTSNYMFGYGMLRSSMLFDYDIGYIGFLNSKINSSIGKIRYSKESDSEYKYMINGVIGLKDFNIIANRFISMIQEFYQINKKINMIRNYGVIYSRDKNISSPIHTKSCDLVFNICLHNSMDIENMRGSLCFYTSQPSILSRYKKNIRLSLHSKTGDIIIHQGSHPFQVFPINQNSLGSCTHLIIECNYTN